MYRMGETVNKMAYKMEESDSWFQVQAVLMNGFSEVSKCIKLILLPLAVETVVKNYLTVFCICSYFIHVRLRNT